MAFERPTLEALIRRARADLATGLPGADVQLHGTPEEVLAVILAGMTHGLYGHQKYLSLQLLADRAEGAFLLRLADIYGLRPKPAAKAQGLITINGTNGSICPAGTIWQRGDGARYSQDADATIAFGIAAKSVTAVVGGVAGNASAGTKLSLTAPVAGIGSTAETATIEKGVDVEPVESLRSRLLFRLRTPPKGGGPGDYVAWAREVAGVTRAWEYSIALGAGTVVVRFMAGDAIPGGLLVAEVQSYINARRPVTAAVTVLAPIAVPLNFTITLTPNTTQVQDAVEAELRDLLRREAEPGGTLLLSHIREAISVAENETNHVLTAPAADVVRAAGEISTFGSVTFL